LSQKYTLKFFETSEVSKGKVHLIRNKLVFLPPQAIVVVS
jgi:hypothetical protein